LHPDIEEEVAGPINGGLLYMPLYFITGAAECTGFAAAPPVFEGSLGRLSNAATL
jgi:hypothetical protein